MDVVPRAKSSSVTVVLVSCYNYPHVSIFVVTVLMIPILQHHPTRNNVMMEIMLVEMGAVVHARLSPTYGHVYHISPLFALHCAAIVNSIRLLVRPRTVMMVTLRVEMDAVVLVKSRQVGNAPQ